MGKTKTFSIEFLSLYSHTYSLNPDHRCPDEKEKGRSNSSQRKGTDCTWNKLIQKAYNFPTLSLLHLLREINLFKKRLWQYHIQLFWVHYLVHVGDSFHIRSLSSFNAFVIPLFRQALWYLTFWSIFCPGKLYFPALLLKLGALLFCKLQLLPQLPQ